MIDWGKRRVELFDLWFHERQLTFDDMLDKIIEQEKKMINEIKNENLLNHYIDTFSFYEER